MPLRSFRHWPALLLPLIAVLGFVPKAIAAPGFSQQTIAVTSDPVNLGGAAVAYAPDGTLYVVQGNQNFGTPSSEIDVVKPNGTLGNPITITADGTSSPAFAGLYSIGGAAWDPFLGTSGSLLVTDGAPGNGALYSINPTTGVATTLFSGDATIAQVAVRSNGDIFVSDAAGFGSGSIDVLNPANHSLVPVVSGLDFAAGIGFDTAGHLIYQEAVFNSPTTTTGEIFQALLHLSGASTTADASTPLATNTGGYDLAVAPNGDAYVTGFGGLFSIDHTTHNVALFDNDGQLDNQFATGLSLLSSTGQLAYIPEFGSPNVVIFTPLAAPEPSALVLALVAGLGAVAAAWRARRDSLTRDR